MRYNLEYRKLTFYCLTRAQTILSSPQDVAVNPNFAKNRDIPVVTRPVTPALPIDTPWTIYLKAD